MENVLEMGERIRLVVGIRLPIPIPLQAFNFSGELVYLNMFGRDIMIVNSRKLAYELFDKRSSKYSDRNLSVMIHEL